MYIFRKRISCGGLICMEDIDYRAVRGLDKSVMRALAKDSAWVRNHENIFVVRKQNVEDLIFADGRKTPLNRLFN
jgi:hypothetical protein